MNLKLFIPNFISAFTNRDHYRVQIIAADGDHITLAAGNDMAQMREVYIQALGQGPVRFYVNDNEYDMFDSCLLFRLDMTVVNEIMHHSLHTQNLKQHLRDNTAELNPEIIN